mmetsp:Transcript_4162/g.6490  ORF Transcript_4162/g.6490 Transcript_4162/m.6490 type:complete len:906 (+) Transcript_4162:167-2884(+)
MYTCGFCGLTFKQRSSKSRHIKLKHLQSEVTSAGAPDQASASSAQDSTFKSAGPVHHCSEATGIVNREDSVESTESATGPVQATVSDNSPAAETLVSLASACVPLTESAGFRKFKAVKKQKDLRKFHNLLKIREELLFSRPLVGLELKAVDGDDTKYLWFRSQVFQPNATTVLPVLVDLYKALVQPKTGASKPPDKPMAFGVQRPGVDAVAGAGPEPEEETSDSVPKKAWTFWKNDGARFFPAHVWENGELLNDAVERYLIECSRAVRNLSQKTLSNNLRYLLLFTRLLVCLQTADETQLALVEVAVQESQRLTTTETVNASLMPVTDPVALFKLRNQIASRLCQQQKQVIDPFLAAFFSGISGNVSRESLRRFCFSQLQPFVDLSLRIWSVACRIQVSQNLQVPDGALAFLKETRRKTWKCPTRKRTFATMEAGGFGEGEAKAKDDAGFEEDQEELCKEPTSKRSATRGFVSKLVPVPEGFRLVIMHDKVGGKKEHTSISVPFSLAQYLCFLIRYGRANPESSFVFQAERGGFWKNASRDLRTYVEDELGIDTQNTLRGDMFIHGLRKMSLACCSVMWDYDTQALRDLSVLMRHDFGTMLGFYCPWVTDEIAKKANARVLATFGSSDLPEDVVARQKVSREVKAQFVRLQICSDSFVRHKLMEDLGQFCSGCHAGGQVSAASKWEAFGTRDVGSQTEAFVAETRNGANDQDRSLDFASEPVEDDNQVAATPVFSSDTDSAKKELGNLDGEQETSLLKPKKPPMSGTTSTASLRTGPSPKCGACGETLVLFGPHGTRRDSNFGKMYLHCNSSSCCLQKRPSRDSRWYPYGHVPAGAVTFSQRPRNLVDIYKFVRAQPSCPEAPAGTTADDCSSLFPDSLFRGTYISVLRKKIPDTPFETEQEQEV